MQYGPSYSMTDLGGANKYKQSVKDASSAIGSLYGQIKAPLQKMMPDMTPYANAFESAGKKALGGVKIPGPPDYSGALESAGKRALGSVRVPGFPDYRSTLESMGKRALGSMRMPGSPSADQYKAYAQQAAKDFDDQRAAKNQPVMQYMSNLRDVRTADATARPAPSPAQMTQSLLGSRLTSMPQLRPGNLVSTNPQQREAIYIEPAQGQRPAPVVRNAINDLTKPVVVQPNALKTNPMQSLVPATRGGQMIQPSMPAPSLDTRRARMLEDDVAVYDGLRAQGMNPDMARGSMIANDAISGDMDRRTGEPGTIRRGRWAARQQADSQVNDAIARRALMDPSAMAGNRTGIARINSQLADQQSMNDAAAREDQLNQNAAFFDGRYAEAAENPMQDIVPSRDEIKLAERLQAQGRDVSAQDIAQYNAQDRARRQAVREQNAQLPGYDSMGRSPLRQRAAAERETLRNDRLAMKREAQRGRFESAYARRHGYAPNEEAAMLMAMGQGTQVNPNQAMESFGQGFRNMGYNDMMRDTADTQAFAQLGAADMNANAQLGSANIAANAGVQVAQIQANAEQRANEIQQAYNRGLLDIKSAESLIAQEKARYENALSRAQLGTTMAQQRPDVVAQQAYDKAIENGMSQEQAAAAGTQAYNSQKVVYDAMLGDPNMAALVGGGQAPGWTASQQAIGGAQSPSWTAPQQNTQAAIANMQPTKNATPQQVMEVARSLEQSLGMPPTPEQMQAALKDQGLVVPESTVKDLRKIGESTPYNRGWGQFLFDNLFNRDFRSIQSNVPPNLSDEQYNQMADAERGYRAITGKGLIPNPRGRSF